MDLYAYGKIGELSAVAKANNIDVPRLRGYALMGLAVPVSDERLEEMFKQAELYECERGCTSIPSFAIGPSAWEFSARTDRLKNKYLIRDEEHDVTGFRWDLLHGKRKKNLKFAIKKRKKRISESVAAWNRYAGRHDVLRVHARIGGENWAYFGGEELRKQPWFIEKVDDEWDNTYCDIYAKIGEPDVCARRGIT